MQIWDAKTGRLRHALNSGLAGVNCMIIAPDGRWLAVCTTTSEIQIWSTTGKTAAAMRIDGRLNNLAWSPGADALYIAGTRGLYAFDLIPAAQTQAG